MKKHKHTTGGFVQAWQDGKSSTVVHPSAVVLADGHASAFVLIFS